MGRRLQAQTTATTEDIGDCFSPRFTHHFIKSVQDTCHHSDDDIDDADELEHYLRMKVVLDSACPNRWMDHAAIFPNLVRMALNYVIIPATSVDAERAFSACTLSLGKLRIVSLMINSFSFARGTKQTCSLISVH